MAAKGSEEFWLSKIIGSANEEAAMFDILSPQYWNFLGKIFPKKRKAPHLRAWHFKIESVELVNVRKVFGLSKWSEIL